MTELPSRESFQQGRSRSTLFMRWLPQPPIVCDRRLLVFVGLAVRISLPRRSDERLGRWRSARSSVLLVESWSD